MEICKIFFNIDYDIQYHSAKSQIKIQQCIWRKNDKLHYRVSGIK
jgi:hypothetical protein